MTEHTYTVKVWDSEGKLWFVKHFRELHLPKGEGATLTLSEGHPKSYVVEITSWEVRPPMIGPHRSDQILSAAIDDIIDEALHMEGG